MSDDAFALLLIAIFIMIPTSIHYLCDNVFFPEDKNEREKYKLKLSESIRRDKMKEEKERIERQERDYWVRYWGNKQLDGFQFEEAVGELYKKLGYKVEVTQGSGDGGVDIKIGKDGKKGIIQCKAHSHQVGPKDVRELWGVKDDFEADYAIFVAYSGVTTAAKDFTRNKEYTIIDKEDLIKMSLMAYKE